MRPHGRARVNPQSPDAFGVCDRDGFLYNLKDLHWQYDWRGNRLMNLRIRVCKRCLDKPFEFYRPIILPPDPVGIPNARPENFTQQENAPLLQRANFTGADNTLLDTYTGESGCTFAPVFPFQGTLELESNNAVPGPGTGNGFAAFYASSPAVTWPSYVVSAIFTSVDGLFADDGSYIVARWTPAVDGNYLGFSNGGTGNTSAGLLTLKRNAGDPALRVDLKLPAGTIKSKTNYVVMLSCQGIVLYGYVMRLDDAFWLNSAGVWQTFPVACISAPNPQGVFQDASQAGIYMDQNASNVGVTAVSNFLVYVQGALPVP